MTYETYSLSAPLNLFITHFTYYKNYTPFHSIDRFLPNGNTEIVIDLTDSPKYIYDNDNLSEIQACNKLWVSGVRTNFITIPSGRDSEMFVINFKKGKVYPFLGLPLCEISDKVIDGDLILHKAFLELREQLLDCELTANKFRVAERLLMRNFISKLSVNAVIEYAVKYIIDEPEVAVIKSIANKTGYSSKHLIHLFEKNVGVTPKTFLRIIRFQKAVQEIQQKGQVNFARLALDCGYFDQSHFIADFRAFSGFTPAEYQKKKNDLADYVPVR